LPRAPAPGLRRRVGPGREGVGDTARRHPARSAEPDRPWARAPLRRPVFSRSPACARPVRTQTPLAVVSKLSLVRQAATQARQVLLLGLRCLRPAPSQKMLPLSSGAASSVAAACRPGRPRRQPPPPSPTFPLLLILGVTPSTARAGVSFPRSEAFRAAVQTDLFACIAGSAGARSPPSLLEIRRV